MRRRRLRFETMEKRQLLAGDILFPSDVPAAGEVRVVVSGGNMVITGDITPGVSLDEQVKVVAEVDAPNFVITGLAGTKVNGMDSASFSGVTGSITIDLKGGNNVVDFGQAGVLSVTRALTIRSGVGSDTINITNTNVNGTLTIDAGAGTNTVTLKGIGVTGNASIKGTIGDDTVTIEDTAGTTKRFNGTLTVDGGAGTNVVTLKNLTIARNVSVIGTTGQDTVNITGSNVSNGALSVTIGAGEGNVTLLNVNVARGISVVGLNDKDTVNITDATIANGALSVSTGAGEGIVTLGNVNITSGNLSVIGTTGQDTVNITTANLSNGTLSVNGGAGTNDITLGNLTNVRSVSVIGTTGQDTVKLTNVTVGNTPAGLISISTGAGVGNVTLNTVTIPRGNLSVIGTTDQDDVRLTGVTLGNGSLSLSTGAGVGNVTLSNVTLNRGNLSVIGTTGNDDVDLTNTTTSNGTMTIDVGAGTNTMDLLGVFASGNATIKGSTGQDTVTIEPIMEGEAVITQSKYTGALLIDLGTVAKNSVTIGPTVVTGDLTIKSPTASEKISVKNVNVTLGRLSIEAGRVDSNPTAIKLENLVINRDLVVVAQQTDSDNQTMSLKGSRVSGSLSVNAGTGRIKVLIQDNEVIAGNATLTAGGFDQLSIQNSPITGNVTIKSTTGSDNVNITASQIDGRLSVDLGAGLSDTFQLSGGNVAKDISIKTLATGTGAVTIEGMIEVPLSISGNLTITTGNAADDLKVKRVAVTGAVTIVSGAGPDDIGLKAVAASADLKIDAGLNPIAVDSNDDGTYELLNLDRIAVVGGSARNVTIDGGDSAASTGPGASQILLTGFNANGNLTITGGNSRDHIGVGDANELDVLATDVGVIDEIIEQLGDDNSGLLGGVTVGGTLTINTFNEQDHVWLHTVTTKSLLIDTSFNLDFVKIYGLTGSGGTGSRLSINLGNGNDTLTLSGVTPTQFASRLIDGGVSSDTLITPSPKIAANDAVFKNWETFESLTPSV